MKTDSEIRIEGMQALISTLGLVEAERFVLIMTRDRFDSTQWRQHGLPKTSLKELALLGKQSDPTDRPPLELHEDLVEVLSGNSPSTPERL